MQRIRGNRSERARDAIREVTDARALRALAHPLRLALYELVTREGVLTCTAASELIGESTARCSFHLRQLAKYGYLEPAPGGRGRERPWRRSSSGTRFVDSGSDADFPAVTEAVGRLAAQRFLDQLQQFLGSRPAPDDPWPASAFVHDCLLYLTPAELAELRDAVLRLTRKYFPRTVDPRRRPSGARAISVLASGFPLRPLPSGR
jgi:Helix-turn-helix domain